MTAMLPEYLYPKWSNAYGAVVEHSVVEVPAFYCEALAQKLVDITDSFTRRSVKRSVQAVLSIDEGSNLPTNPLGNVVRQKAERESDINVAQDLPIWVWCLLREKHLHARYRPYRHSRTWIFPWGRMIGERER